MLVEQGIEAVFAGRLLMFCEQRGPFMGAQAGLGVKCGAIRSTSTISAVGVGFLALRRLCSILLSCHVMSGIWSRVRVSGGVDEKSQFLQGLPRGIGQTDLYWLTKVSIECQAWRWMGRLRFASSSSGWCGKKITQDTTASTKS